MIKYNLVFNFPSLKPSLVYITEMQSQRDLWQVRVNRSQYALVALAVCMIEAEPPLQRRYNNLKGHPAEKAAKSQYIPSWKAVQNGTKNRELKQRLEAIKN